MWQPNGQTWARVLRATPSVALTLTLAGCVSHHAPSATSSATTNPMATQGKSAAYVPTSGRFFGSHELRLQQEDAAQNPGYLWVENGRNVFTRDCVRCHEIGTAAALALSRPRVVADGDAAENLDDAVNQCQTRRVGKTAYAPESTEMLSVTAYLMNAALGKVRAEHPSFSARVDSTSPAWERGRELWFARQGKQDLSCAMCHDGLVGMRLLNQTVSQGHTSGFPAYRLEWQGLGSVERRIRACAFGMQTVVPPPGDARLRALELYMAHRSADVAIETPAVRR